MNALDGLIYLCRCAVNSITPDKDRISSLDLDEVYDLAYRHLLTATVGLTLEDAHIENEKFKKAVFASYYRALHQETENEAVFTELEKAAVWYLPLKGTLIKDWYPKFGMREMADTDIMIDASNAAAVRDIMVSLGFEVEKFDSNIHDVYIKKPTSNFEIHKALMNPSSGELFCEYYKDVESRLLKDESFCRSFSSEDFYIYFLVHEYKHYSFGGTGLRSLLDTYVVLEHFRELDRDYISLETNKLGLTDFERENRTLAQELFGVEERPVSNRKMLDYFVGSGTYGTLQNVISNDIKKFGGPFGKIKYVFHRIFLPMKDIKKTFPTFYKYKFLIPFLPLYRVLRRRKSAQFKIELYKLFRE